MLTLRSVRNGLRLTWVLRQALRPFALSQASAGAGVDQLEEELNAEARMRVERTWRDHVLSARDCPPGGRGRPAPREGDREKMYVLAMFPYPSGALHMGHVRVYALSDALARFHRMQGKQVLHPVGWDAFGLPAENAARAHGADAAEWTHANVRRMRRTLRRLGLAFDWPRELSTAHPAYFRWTQWLFVRLMRRGLAYRKEAEVLWDPVDGTVLAEEQVDADGRAWRSGAAVQRKTLSQWFIRTRQFAQALLDGLEDPLLDNWRDVKALQAHWLGACDGVLLDLDLVAEGAADGVAGGAKGAERLEAWTAAPEALPEARFVLVRGDSPLARRAPATLNVAQPLQGVPAWRRLPWSAVHPLTGAPLPLLAVDVGGGADGEAPPGAEGWLPWEGDGARLGVPSASPAAAALAQAALAHLAPLAATKAAEYASEEERAAAAESVLQALRARGVSAPRCSARLRDWLVSRQRAWGTPVPAAHCVACGAQPVPEDQLPVPPAPASSAARAVWERVACPQCGGEARRDGDSLDTFVDSSWYFVRFCDPRNESALCGAEASARMLPVDVYVGGKEHAVLHLFYARFVTRFLHAEGLVPHPEPFRRLLPQGMVMGKALRTQGSQRYLRPEDVDFSGAAPVERGTGAAVEAVWEKMSKSRFNGVDPEGLIDDFGCDSVRLFVLADVAPTSHRRWSSDTFPGAIGWQRRLWLTVRRFVELRHASARAAAGEGKGEGEDEAFRKEEERLRDARNFYVRGATFHFCETLQISVAVSKAQGLTSALRRAPEALWVRGAQFERALSALLRLVAPLTPHLACELWRHFAEAPSLRGEDETRSASVLEQPWPRVDADYALPVDLWVNGRPAGRVALLPAQLAALTRERALELALTQPTVTRLVAACGLADARLRLFAHCGGELRISLCGDTGSASVRQLQQQQLPGEGEGVAEAATPSKKRKKKAKEARGA